MQFSDRVYAALDLGSNSFHLVIAKVENDRLFFLDRVKLVVRLANGLKSDGSLSRSARKRALLAFNIFEERLRGFHDLSVRVVGTNTLRAAKKSESFLAEAERILGFPIAIINGREEARLVYKGVIETLEPLESGRFVVDIGGGSTELIYGGMEPEQMESLHMGCVSFSRTFFPNGRITRKRYLEAKLAAKLELEPVVREFRECEPGQVLGSSGTIKTIEAVLDEMGILGEGITLQGLESLSGELIACGNVKNLHLPGLKPERAPVFTGGVAILHAVYEEMELLPMQASSSALREGLLYEMIGRRENRDQRDQTVKELQIRYLIDLKQSQRVKRLSIHLFDQLRGPTSFDHRKSIQYLGWASDLHETGLSISHSGYHKHGSYILRYSDLSGFNRAEKRILSFLVGNHRRRIRLSPECRRFDPPWGLLLVFRLACLLLRNRNETRVPQICLMRGRNSMKIELDKEWLKENPLTARLLEQEKQIWKDIGKKLKIRPLSHSKSK